MTTPMLSANEARNQQTFTALMWALSRPGEVQTFAPLEGDMTGLETIAQTVLDLETSFFTPDTGLCSKLKHTGARCQPADRAAYGFYPALELEQLFLIESAPIGTLSNPDHSATLAIVCEFGRGAKLELSGPGIRDKTRLEVSGLPLEFFKLRNRAVSFPLGWDVLFVSRANDEIKLVGIPRSTHLEILGGF
jgi:alpha-D-ribose 1-methylphosphonate 5-triphosphate synthase subunit PhnH